MPVLSKRFAVLAVCAFIVVHGLLAGLFPAQSLAISYVVYIVVILITTLSSFRATLRPASPARVMWALLTLGLLLWGIGMVISAWVDLFKHESSSIASYSDLLFFFYGVPLLLAMSLPRADQRSGFFIAIDVIQVCFVAYLTYAQVFSILPFSGERGEPLPVSRLVYTYDVENLVLGLACTARLLSSPSGTDERHFFVNLALFLWTYAVAAGTYNHAIMLVGFDSGHWFDCIVDIPFLVLTGSLLSVGNPQLGTATSRNLSRVGLFVDSVSPSFFTLAIVALGASVALTHFELGIAAIGIAIVIYALRGTIVQNRYVLAQESLRDAHDQLAHLSTHDPLSGVANRRGFDDELSATWGRARRSGAPISLLFVDIDYFKNINDSFGHRHGDECITNLAQALSGALPRQQDMLARYGGEEFAAILPETDQDGAFKVAQRMRDAVAALAIKNTSPTGSLVTVSIGACTYRGEPAANYEELIQRADKALYRAKSNGRDRIEALPFADGTAAAQSS
jgi:diguanylate cyclase (GGDEF)-like protein